MANGDAPVLRAVDQNRVEQSSAEQSDWRGFRQGEQEATGGGGPMGVGIGHGGACSAVLGVGRQLVAGLSE